MMPGMLIGKDDHFVYALLDNQWLEVYVGVTSDPVRRLNQHLSRPCENLRDFLEQGGTVTMIILSHHRSRRKALAAEKAEIWRLAPMLNTQGMPPLGLPPIQQRAMSETPPLGWTQAKWDTLRVILEDEPRRKTQLRLDLELVERALAPKKPAKPVWET